MAEYIKREDVVSFLEQCIRNYHEMDDYGAEATAKRYLGFVKSLPALTTDSEVNE